MIVDFGKKQGRNYTPLNINGSSVERVDSFQYFGVHVTKGLTWALHTDTLSGEEDKDWEAQEELLPSGH